MPLHPELLEYFHRYFAAWTRIEPRCRSNDFSRGLEARTADPLWMLARQWQVGEFTAQDAGSPIDIDVVWKTLEIDQLDVGRKSSPVSLQNEPPVETLVEFMHTGRDLRTRVQIGQQFERTLRAQFPDDADKVIQLYRSRFPVRIPAEVDRASQRFMQLVADRAIDGDQLLAADDNTLPDPAAESALTTNDIKNVIALVDDWLAKLRYEPAANAPTAWQPRHLDHRFMLHANAGDEKKVTLRAPDYRNGDFDWFTCKLYDDTTVAADWKEEQKKFPPTLVSFAGMPHPRWWAFEDSRTDFGDLDVAKPDLAKLVLMEFALVYGDDWFLLPVPIPSGHLAAISSVHVKNVFGERIPIEPGRSDGAARVNRWELFTLDRDGPLKFKQTTPESVQFPLFIPPVSGFREESPPIEEVRFLRDEGANMVWGVEHTIPNTLGNPADGFEAHLERLEEDDEPETPDSPVESDHTRSDVPEYNLESKVPANWIPFIPALAGFRFGPTSGTVRLRRAKMLLNEKDKEPVDVDALGSLLRLDRNDPLLWIDEDSIGRAGLTLQLTKQRLRWIDGKTYVWLGRKALIGRGERSSGLTFDFLSQPTNE
jgi:hypothetical protein